MGKNFVIMEVESVSSDEAAGFQPIGCPGEDGTWIDPRHVIDESALHQRIFAICGNDQDEIALPPKPEGDEFWKWADGHPNPNDERFWGGERKFNLDNYDRARKAWLAKMPRKL